MKKLLAFLLFATVATAALGSSLQRLDVQKEFRPPRKANCANLTSQRLGALCIDTDLDIDGDGSAEGTLMQYDGTNWNRVALSLFGTALPGSCVDGETFIDTDAATGQRLFACESGSFVQQGGAGSSQWTDLGSIIHAGETGDDIALGGTTLVNASKLSIDGDADQVQLTVQGFSTQTDSVVIVENSSGTEVINLDVSGNILSQSIQDIDGPGTNWSITAAGAITALSYGGITEAALVDKTAAEVITGNWDFGAGGLEIENAAAVPGSCTDGEIFLDTDATSGQQLMGCESGAFVLQGDGGGGGNAFSTIGVAVADVATDTMTITDSLSIDITTTNDPEDLTAAFLYTATQAGDPALGAEETIFTTDGSGGGGLLFEGTTADTNEGLLQWNPTTDKVLTLPDATDTVVGRATTDTLTNKTIDATNAVTINASDITDQNAGTDITTDMEEEGQINATAVTGNASDDQVITGDGASSAAWLTLPNCVGNNMLTYTTATNTFGCDADDGAGGGAPISVDYLVGTADASLTGELVPADGQGIDWVLTAGNPGSAIFDLLYTDTLAADPAFTAEDCTFTNDGTGGGGLICEGTTANTNEQLYIFPAVDGADTTNFIVVDGTQVTDLEGTGLSITAGTLNVGNISTLTGYVANEHINHSSVTITTGNGISGGGDLTANRTFDVDLNATLDGAGSISSLSGMEFTATSELALLQGCANDEVLVWENTGGTWDCAARTAGAFSDLSDPVVLNTLAKDVSIGAAQVNTAKLSVQGDVTTVPAFTVQAVASPTESVVIFEDSLGAEIFNADNSGDLLVQSIQDIDGPGTTWGITSAGDATFNTITVAASATPSADFDDSDSASEAIDAQIAADSTDTGGGSEDTDLTFRVQVASTITDRLTIDGDGQLKIQGSGVEVDATDPADSGAVRLDNDEGLCWEASPAGTDVCLQADSSEILQVSGGTIDGGDLTAASVGDGALAAGAVDGGSAGEIADNTVDENDLAATLTMSDGDVIDFGTNVTTTNEGILLPANLTTCTSATAEGQVCWEEDAEILWVGNGATMVNINGAGAGDITSVFGCLTGACTSIAAGATDFLDLSGTDGSSLTEGLTLPQHATACGTGFAEGQVCWEADSNILHIGDSAAFQNFLPASAFTLDATVNATGSVTLSDSVTVDLWDLGSSLGTTPSIDDSDTSLATTAFVQAETVAAGAISGSLGGGFTIDDGEVIEDDFAATLTFDDGDLVDFGVFVTSATEGLMVPAHATDCTTATAEGQVCWEEDAKILWIGDGTAPVNINGSGSGDITDVFDCTSGDCSSITVGATDFLDFSGNDSSSLTEGLALPQHATACATGFGEGQVCWEADANILHIGDAAAFQNFLPASAFSTDATVGATGVVTIADSVTVTGWVMGASTATTPSVDDDSTSLATTAFVQDETAGTGVVSGTLASGFTIDDGEIVEDDFAATLTFDDGDLLDFGTNISSATEGILIPAHATDCSAATAEGQLCWEEDANNLWVGDGAAAKQMNAAGASSFGIITDGSTPAGADSSGDTLTVTDSATINFVTSDAPEDLTASIVANSVDQDELAATVTFADGDLLDFGANVTGATEGILLPGHATDCTTGTGEGQVCWEEDATILHIGDGAAVQNFLPASAFSTDATVGATGVVTISDSVTVTGWAMGASTATTPSVDDSSTSLATTAFVQTETAAAGIISGSLGGGFTIDDGEVVEDDLASTLTFDDGDLLDFGSNVNTATEGLMLPANATTCASATAEGQICWEEDATILHVGDGAALQNFLPASAFSTDITVGTTGVVTIADSVTVTGWVMGASTATSPSVDDDDTSLATTEFVQDETPNSAGVIGGTIGTGLTIDDGEVVEDDFAATLTFDDGDLLDFGANVTATGEGIYLPGHATDCSTATAEGQVCWEEDAQNLWVGNGAAAVQMNAASATEVRSMYWGAGAMSTDGTQCVAPAEVTIGSWGKMFTVICADNDASTMTGSAQMPDGWDAGTVTFELSYIQDAADTAIMNADVAARCAGATETPAAYGTEVAIDDAAVTGTDAMDNTTSAAVTAGGTCAAGDFLQWQIQVAVETTTAVASLHFVGVKMEYTTDIGD